MIGATWDASNRKRVFCILASKAFVELESVAIARSCKEYLALNMVKCYKQPPGNYGGCQTFQVNMSSERKLKVKNKGEVGVTARDQGWK